MAGRGKRSARTARPGETDRLGMLPELLGYRLRQAQIAVFQDFCAAMEGFEVTPGRFGVIEVIAANPGLSQSELGALLGIDRSTVVAVIDRLEAAGLVRRDPVPEDRRSYALTLGERGRALLGELRERVRAHERRIARGLSEAEKRLLLDLLDRIARSQ
ncbi:MAG TPA: MarR family transcriptional regulator [Stellaceae bacterium]|nr:MarR family transcriptional regulator [Stellaceae bacterium]